MFDYASNMLKFLEALFNTVSKGLQVDNMRTVFAFSSDLVESRAKMTNGFIGCCSAEEAILG